MQKEEAERKKADAARKKQEREEEAARKKREREDAAIRRKDEAKEEAERRKTVALAQRVAAKLSGITKPLERDTKDKDVKKVPQWCKKQAMDAVKDLNEMLAASQIAIDTRGETPLRCTVDEAEALDKKAKG